MALIKGANTYFVHTDYLNTPRAISNSSGTVVWKWDNTNAYGYNSANETVSGTAFEYNPRFAGQYFDKETGLHYNLNRMYNPELARYMQPDPIGVNGGMNIYSYVENNPLNMIDPLGLFVEDSNGNFQEIVNLIDYKNGKSTAEFPGKKIIGYEYRMVNYDEYKIYTDNLQNGKHMLINISYYSGGSSVSKNFDPRFNCHGWSFLRGKGWMNDSQVQNVLNLDYKKIGFNELKNGDVIIYREGNNIKHSVLAVRNNNGQWVSIGKDGVRPNLQVRLINEQWPTATSTEYYRYLKN